MLVQGEEEVTFCAFTRQPGLLVVGGLFKEVN